MSKAQAPIRHSLPDATRYTRDELRLSTPVGIAIWVQPGTRFAFNVALVAVPVFVLATYNERDRSFL